LDNYLVVGGAGIVGRFIAGLLADAGHAPLIIDREPAGRAFDQRVMDALDLPEQAPELLEATTALVLALPEEVALQVLERCGGAMPALRLLVNTCSVQQPFQECAARLLPGVPSLGINPMFSPTLDCRGRPVVLCEREPGAAGARFATLLTAQGMRVRHLGPEEHDRTMAVCQTLPHAAVMAFAFALQRSECDPGLLAELAPPPMQALLALAARILHNPPQTYWDIQRHNRHGARQREHLAGGLDLLHQFCRQDSADAFAAELEAVRHWFGPGAAGYSRTCTRLFNLLNLYQGELPDARSVKPSVLDDAGSRQGSGTAGDHAAGPAGDHR